MHLVHAVDCYSILTTVQFITQPKKNIKLFTSDFKRMHLKKLFRSATERGREKTRDSIYVGIILNVKIR